MTAGFTPGLTAWRLLTRVLSPVMPLYLRHRAARGKEDWTRLNERLGVAGLPQPVSVHATTDSSRRDAK